MHPPSQSIASHLDRTFFTRSRLRRRFAICAQQAVEASTYNGKPSEGGGGCAPWGRTHAVLSELGRDLQRRTAQPRRPDLRRRVCHNLFCCASVACCPTAVYPPLRAPPPIYAGRYPEALVASTLAPAAIPQRAVAAAAAPFMPLLGIPTRNS